MQDQFFKYSKKGRKEEHGQVGKENKNKREQFIQ